VYEDIRYEVDDPIAIVRLDRPARLNAWSARMDREVRDAFARAERDPAVVAIVLTGEGRGFCAGADLKDLTAISSGTPLALAGSGAVDEALPGNPEMRGFRGRYTYLLSLRKPVIAAINGPCAGMALPIALACDVRFASERAVFTTAFVQRGLIAEWGIAWLLPRVVGVGHALDLLLSGRIVDAREAERMGLVNRVLEHDQLMPHALAYARELGQRCAPRSLSVIKRQVYEALERTHAEENEEAFARMLETLGSEDFKEGVRAFVEKRTPSFSRL
jgi:enoyl-CoA hydratase/carnithine racemase